jgi:hypothetical protein
MDLGSFHIHALTKTAASAEMEAVEIQVLLVVPTR